MLTFKQVGKTNTDVTLKLAIQTALEREMDLVVATIKGDTALRAAELAKEMGFSGKLVAVSCAYGAKAVNENSLSDEVRDRLHQQGVTVVTAAHALSGAERGISKAFGGVYPVEIMAATLRMFGQGVKVCCGDCADGSRLRSDSGKTAGDGGQRNRNRSRYRLCHHPFLHRIPTGDKDK